MVDQFFEFIYVYVFSNKKIKSFINFIILCLLPDRIKRKNVFINLNKKDPVVSGALLFGVFENKEIKIFQTLMKPGATFLDIGANVGLYTAIAGKKLGKNGKVYSFEPNPLSYSTLLKTIKSNNLTNVFPLRAAASNKNGLARLYSSNLNGGDNRMYKNHNLEDFYTYRVKTLNLSDYLLKQGIKSIDFIKIDIQGYEYFAFLGLRKILKKTKSCKILIEFWPYGMKNAGSNAMSLLKEINMLGFFITDIRNSKEVNPKEFSSFIKKYSGRKYTNLLLSK